MVDLVNAYPGLTGGLRYPVLVLERRQMGIRPSMEERGLTHWHDSDRKGSLRNHFPGDLVRLPKPHWKQPIDATRLLLDGDVC